MVTFSRSDLLYVLRAQRLYFYKLQIVFAHCTQRIWWIFSTRIRFMSWGSWPLWSSNSIWFDWIWIKCKDANNWTRNENQEANEARKSVKKRSSLDSQNMFFSNYKLYLSNLQNVFSPNFKMRKSSRKRVSLWSTKPRVFWGHQGWGLRPFITRSGPKYGPIVLADFPAASFIFVLTNTNSKQWVSWGKYGPNLCIAIN